MHQIVWPDRWGRWRQRRDKRGVSGVECFLPRQRAVGSESCRRREQAALDFCALSGLDRDRARIRDNDAGLTVFACSGCIVQFLSSRKPVLELHLLMVSESVASYRLVVVQASASARDLGGVLRAGLQQRRERLVCSGSAVWLWANNRDSSQHSFFWSSAARPVVFSVAGRLAVPSAVSSTGGGNGNPGEWYSKRVRGPLLRRA